MSPLAERVAKAVAHNGPGRAVCFNCLATQQGLEEHDVRAVALVLMVHAGLRVVRRACVSCRRVADGLLAPKAA